MKKLLILFAAMLIAIPALTQERSKFLYAEFADKSVTLCPSLKFYGDYFDPVATFGAGVNYRQIDKIALFQTFQASWYTTRFTGSGVSLMSSLGYRYEHTSGILGEALLGLGASAFFPSRETFAQNEDGIYTPVNPLLLRACLPIDLHLGYRIVNFSFYLKYRYMITGPYTDVLFVPLIGFSETGIGIRYTM